MHHTLGGNVQYLINSQKYSVYTENISEFAYGKNVILSNAKNDITYYQPWYEKGFAEVDFLDINEYSILKEGIRQAIANIISEETFIPNINDFKLENYHHFVRNDETHLKIVTRCRDLFEENFNFPVFKYISRFEDILKMKLTNVFKNQNMKMHVIIRINRPQSSDYNPPHKDIYEGYDILGYPPLFMNFWIPIAGVSINNNLPISIHSHLINEDKILRTFHGARMEGNSYRVRMIKSWDNLFHLKRSKVKYGEVLIFSSHLIHGLAINNEPNLTRVALEYRLFKA